MNTLRILESSAQLDFSKLMVPETGELIVPVVCIDSARLATEGIAAYRMQGFANREAIDATLETGRATFYSRKRDRLWTKGEESGNFLIVRAAYTDCDSDSVLLDVDAQGPTCHTGQNSCFEMEGSD